MWTIRLTLKEIGDVFDFGSELVGFVLVALGGDRPDQEVAAVLDLLQESFPHILTSHNYFGGLQLTKKVRKINPSPPIRSATSSRPKACARFP